MIERAVLVAVILAATVAISPNVADPDLWGHVQYGRDLLQHGLPPTTTYSYIAQNQPWINHENLMEVLLALGAEGCGPIGLVLLKLLAGLTLLVAIQRVCRKQGAGLTATCLVLLLAASGMARYWSLRPQLFSFAAYAAMLWLLAWCFEGWEGQWRLRIKGLRTKDQGSEEDEVVFTHRRLRWLWLVVPLMAAWTNAHGGFLAGAAIFAAYLGMRGLEAYSNCGLQAIGLIKRFSLMIVGVATATLINPYGFQFHLWLFDDLRVPRPEITEWLPPGFADPHSIPLILLIATFAITLAFSRRSFDATHLVILLATLWQSLEHQRHIPFFALSVAFFLPRHVQSVLDRFAASRESNGTLASGPHSPVSRLAIVLGLVAAYATLGWKLYDRASDLKVNRDHFPVSAVEFIARHNLRGRVVCTFTWAQYLLAAFPASADGSGLLVHVDGRCRTAYSQQSLDEHFDFLFGNQPLFQRYRDPHNEFDDLKALDHGYPNLVLIDRGQPHSVGVMESQQHRWALLYQDSLAQIWGRRERYDDHLSPDYLPVTDRRIGNEVQQGHVTWPAFPIAGIPHP